MARGGITSALLTPFRRTGTPLAPDRAPPTLPPRTGPVSPLCAFAARCPQLGASAGAPSRTRRPKERAAGGCRTSARNSGRSRPWGLLHLLWPWARCRQPMRRRCLMPQMPLALRRGLRREGAVVFLVAASAAIRSRRTSRRRRTRRFTDTAGDSLRRAPDPFSP